MAGITTAKQRGISMRGIINSIRFFIAQVQEHGFKEAVREQRQELARDIEYHFGLYRGQPEPAVFVRLPFTRFSAWLEWREINGGVSFEREAGTVIIWLGRLEATFSADPQGYSAEGLE